MIKCVSSSNNSKIGKGVACTYREVGPTCPQECEHLQKGSCYALYAFVGMHQKQSGYHDTDPDRISHFVRTLPKDKKVRHHVSGDVLKPTNQIDYEYIMALLLAHAERPDLEGWTYTHAWKRLNPSHMNSQKSLAVNASCDSLEEAFEAIALGWPATMTVNEDEEGGIVSLDGEHARLVVCPNQTHDLSCKDCMLCFRKERNTIVGFRVHGTGKAKF